jgi:hypothetical protein
MSEALTEDRIRAVVDNYQQMSQKMASDKQYKKRMKQSMSLDRLPDVSSGEAMLEVLGPQLDAVGGPGFAEFTRDNERLAFIVGVLAQGTVADAIRALEDRSARLQSAAHNPAELLEKTIKGARVDSQTAQRMIDHITQSGGLDILKKAGSNDAPQIARLRSITSAEIQAVLNTLDVIESLHPLGARAIRTRHL